MQTIPSALITSVDTKLQLVTIALNLLLQQYKSVHEVIVLF
jgi:hypothetical protein